MLFIAYLNVFTGSLCALRALWEFGRMSNTDRWILFSHTLFAGLNLFFANRYFGWF